MNILIEEINAGSVSEMNTCDGEFSIDARLVLDAGNDEIRYKIIKSPHKTKRYRADEMDYQAYVDDPDKTAFFARVGGRVVGQIILRKYWNNYAYIDDIAVDKAFRRQGIGEKLIARAEGWARSRNLAGITLETQNNNVGACKFYENCGFRLGGFDRYLYKGINKDTDEIALYWVPVV